MKNTLGKQKSMPSTSSRPEICQIPGADVERVESGQKALFDEETYAETAGIFRALGDPSRVKIVYSLLKQELCTCDLAAITGQSESSVSQHLRTLRQLRLVKNRRSGKQVFYSLDDEHIRLLLLVCLDHVRNANTDQPGLSKILELFKTDK